MSLNSCPGLHISLSISNLDSTDGTYEFLQELETKPTKYPVHIYNKPIFDNGQIVRQNPFSNFKAAIDVVPGDVDWIWVMGDDDNFIEPNALIYLKNLIEQHVANDINYIHPCQSNRSKRTNNILKGSIMSLANTYGWHEIFGWMSARVIRTSKAKEFFYIPYAENHLKSPFGDVFCLFELCHKESMIYVDSQWQSTQEQTQSKESLVRWSETNTGERYVLMPEVFYHMHERGVLGGGVKKMFFRYHQYHLWDRLAVNVLAAVLSSGSYDQRLKQNIARISLFGEMLADAEEKKAFRIWLNQILYQIEDYTSLLEVASTKREKLIAFANQVNMPVYPWTEII